MAKNKPYSPEAIQKRQQADLDEYNRRMEAAKPKKKEAETAQPQFGSTGSGTSSTRPYGGTYDPSFKLPPVKQTNPNIPNTPPYMAQGTANVETILGTDGTEPIYYTGRPREGWQGTIDAAIGNPLKNWMRRTWAAIHNPYDYLPNPTKEQEQEIKERVAQLQEQPINYQGHEVSSDQRAKALQLIGLDLNEVLTSQATEEVARKQGDTSVTGTLITKTVKTITASTAFALLGAPEWVVRNGAAVIKTIDDVADDVAGEDKDRINPIGVSSGIEKFNKAVMESQYSEIFKRIPALNILQNYDFLNVLRQMTPLSILKDAGRLVVNLDKIESGQFVKTLNMNLAGSQMVYTLFRDQAAAADYERRYNDGESPILLVKELQDAGTELLGGIIFDPTTYIGGSAIKHADDGTRIVDKLAKSAADTNITNTILDTRIPVSIREAIDSVVDGAKISSKEEILEKVGKAFRTTAEEFQVWKTKRGITSLTSTGKQSLVIEQARDFLRSLAARAQSMPGGMDEMVGAIDAMKKLAKQEGNLEEAFSYLVKTPLGEIPLSPRGMRVASLIAGVDDEMPALLKAIESGDIRKVADVYAQQVEKTIGKTILSVDEMAEAASKVRKITDDLGGAADVIKLREAAALGDKKAVSALENLDDQIRIAQEYKDLSPVVKFVSGVNRAGQNTWMKPLSFLSGVYFGVNRFAYPARNVYGAVIGMSYEFGLTDAITMGTKAITGSQIEVFGNKYLQNMVSEIEKIAGYVPEAVLRSNTPIGEVDVSRRYLSWLIPGGLRGGSEVAGLSEQLMAAQIVLKTVKREVNNAIKHGAIPDTVELVRAGLKAEDVDVLLKYAVEYQGDTNKILDSFRRFMGGSEDLFRHIPLQEKLDEFLDYIGNGQNSLKKELIALRDTAQTPAEFTEGAQKIWEKVEGAAEISRTDKINLSDDLEQVFRNDISRAQMLQSVSEEGLDNFDRVLQGFRNAKKSMISVEETLKGYLHGRGAAYQEFTPIFTAIRNEVEDASRVDPVRRLVNSLSDDSTMTSQQIYQKLEESLPDFKISTFTEVDPSKVSRKEMVNIMWESYFMWTGKHYADKANQYNKSVVAALQSMTEEVNKLSGEAYTIADYAKMTGAPYKQAIEDFQKAYKYYEQSAIDTMSFTRARVPNGTTLVNLDFEAMKDAGWSSKNHLFNSINKYRKEHGLEKWLTHDQVEMWEIQDAVRRMKRTQGFVPTDSKMDMITGTYESLAHPPIPGDKAITQSRMIADSLPRAKKDFDNYINNVIFRWGETQPPAGALTDTVEDAIAGWSTRLTGNMNNVRTEAANIAVATRDAMLYDYRKQLWQVAAQYVSPFNYYHTSASKQWLQNVAADPKWAAVYIDYKEYMTERHAGLPDFWKSNLAVSLPGMDKDNPLFFNIEASVNPLYQMIGQDFNDPARRVDLFSSSMDNLSKLVPGIYAPLQWAVAANLYAKGEKEAGELWMGRLIPQTKLIKTVSNALGISIPGTKYNELDPFVGLLGDGLDPYEEKRVLRYLATMPGVSEEQRMEAAHLHQGDTWDAAVRAAMGNRAGAEVASFFLGVGYKPRTKSDIETDNFYNDYRKLLAARSVMPSTEYRDAWDSLREKYPFMDTLLIGKKAGSERDTAMAYSVLNRIPPGEITDIAEILGVKPSMLQTFYDTNGDWSKMTGQDKDRFMAAILDLSSMLKMPSGATREEWSTARDTYASMNSALKERYGDDILEKMDKFYNFNETEQQGYLQAYPEVEAAMRDKNAYVVNTPILSAYYASLDTVRNYYNNKVYIQLDEEFGEDIDQKMEYYYLLKDNLQEAEAKKFYKENNLKAYQARKTELFKSVDPFIVEMGRNIPEGKGYTIRPEFQPLGDYQTEGLDYVTSDQQAEAAQAVWNDLSPTAKVVIQAYLESGEDMPPQVAKQIEYIAEKYGLSKYEALQLLGVELK